MGILRAIVLAGVLSGLGRLAAADPVTPPPPLAQALAPTIWFIAGSTDPGWEPDGNTVVFATPSGLVVLDTGRHAWHWRSILELAHRRDTPIVAIVNTHWHLDHVSGNPALREAFPGTRVYASDAIDRALPGFLASSLAENRSFIDDPAVSEEIRADLRSDAATIANGAALKPDVVIGQSGPLTLGGHAFRINLERDAATSGDLWLYDPDSRIAALGDLVTLPAPFLDTACPQGWKLALAHVSAAPFRTAVPGHGAPMTRSQFIRYRRAFDAFVDCARSERASAQCGSAWAQAVQPLLGHDPQATKAARGIAGYYVGVLRANGGRSKYCEAARGAD